MLSRIVLLVYQVDKRGMSVNVRDEERTKLGMAGRIPEQDQPSIPRQQRSKNSVVTGVGGPHMCHLATHNMRNRSVSCMMRKPTRSIKEYGPYVVGEDATVFPSKTQPPTPPRSPNISGSLGVVLA